jgi:hypothetical protein
MPSKTIEWSISLQQVQLVFRHSDAILWSQDVQVQTLSTNSVALVVSFEFIFLYSIINYKKFNTSSIWKKVTAPMVHTNRPIHIQWLVVGFFYLILWIFALTKFIMSSNEAFLIRKTLILFSWFWSILLNAEPPTTTGNLLLYSWRIFWINLSAPCKFVALMPLSLVCYVLELDVWLIHEHQIPYDKPGYMRPRWVGNLNPAPASLCEISYLDAYLIRLYSGITWILL